MSFNAIGQRICDECGEVLKDGFIIDFDFGKAKYCKHYCKECFNKHYTIEEFSDKSTSEKITKQLK